MQHIMHIYFNFTFEPVEETGPARRNIRFPKCISHEEKEIDWISRYFFLRKKRGYEEEIGVTKKRRKT